MGPGFYLLAGISGIALGIVVAAPRWGLLARIRDASRGTNRFLLEDILKYVRTARAEGQHPRIDAIAGALSISTNRATTLVDQLVRNNLAIFTEGTVSLTETGKETAIHIIRAHRLWERYLSERTGYGAKEWHPLAEIREHAITPDEADALAARLGNPTHDPHGDPIPLSDGSGPIQSGGSSLDSANAGSVVEVVHIEDEPEEVYAQIVATGIYPGSRLEVLEKTRERMRLAIDGSIHAIAPIVAANISVVPSDTETTTPSIAITLDTLPQGALGEVVRLSQECRGSERRRLLDLGIVPGTKIVAELDSAGGDPRAYRVRETLIAIRDAQARNIYVTESVAHE